MQKQNHIPTPADYGTHSVLWEMLGARAFIPHRHGIREDVVLGLVHVGLCRIKAYPGFNVYRLRTPNLANPDYIDKRIQGTREQLRADDVDAVLDRVTAQREQRTQYTIENADTSVILGTYTASSEAEALDLMAQAAGYAAYADVPGDKANLRIHEVPGKVGPQ